MLIAQDFARALDPTILAADAGFELDPWQATIVREQPRRAILLASRQSGKSTAVSIIALSVATAEPDSLIVVAAPSFRQSTELLRTIGNLHRKLQNVPEITSDAVQRIELDNGSRILALPGSEDGKTVRGLSNARLILVDESQHVPDSLLTALRPMLATNKRGSQMLLGTPAGKRGHFHSIWTNEDGKYSDWARVQVSCEMCPRLTPEWLAEERRAHGEARFQSEYCLQFLDSGVSAFPTDLIEAMFDSSVKPLWS